MYPRGVVIFVFSTLPKAAADQPANTSESALSGSTADARKKQLGTISIEIKTARNQAGFTVTDLHKKTGISRNVLQGYESGKFAPGTLELKKICEVLRVTPNRILYGNEQPMKTKVSLVDRLGDINSQRGTVILALLFSMLSSSESSAILALLESVIRAKVGGEKQIQQAYEVLDALLDNELLDALAQSSENALTHHFTPDKTDKLKDKFSQIVSN